MKFLVRIDGPTVNLESNFALPSGKHVLLGTGPIPQNLAELVAQENHVLMIAGAGQTGNSLRTASQTARSHLVEFAITNPRRLLPSRKLIKQELAAGKLGEPGLIRAHHWEESATGTIATRELPTALLQELDVVLWLMGKSPITVFALEHTGEGPRPRWDRYPGSRYLQVHLGFPGDAMVLLDFSSLHPPGDPYRSLHVIGSLGAAYVDDHQNMQLLYGWGQPRGVMASEVRNEADVLLRDFAEGLATGRDFTEMIAAWEKVLIVAAAVERSIQSRQAVSLEGR